MSRSKGALRRPVGGPVGPGSGPARPVVGPVDRLLNRISRDELSLSCSSRKPSQIDQIEGKRWNWRLKVGEIVDQAQQHQIHGPKPLKTQPNHRSVKRQFRAIFGDFFGKFSRNEIGWVEGQIRGNQELLIPYDEV